LFDFFFYCFFGANNKLFYLSSSSGNCGNGFDDEISLSGIPAAGIIFYLSTLS
jgi:hypothetical protein